MNFWIHYTISEPLGPGSAPVHLVLGPYTADEAIDQRLATLAQPWALNVYISDRQISDRQEKGEAK